MTTRDFYDRISPFYHLIYGEWDASVERQGKQLHDIISQRWADVHEVLDVTVGIGTQAIGLAKRGYHVTGLDIAPNQIERGRKEAARYQVEIDFHVADMREASSFGEATFDLVLSADNAVTHLLTDEELVAAFRQFHACLRPGGGLLISMRDYDKVDRQGTHVVPFGLRQEEGIRYLIFQVWQFDADGKGDGNGDVDGDGDGNADGPCYDLSMYFVEDAGGEQAKTHVMRSRYYAIGVGQMKGLIEQAGFVDVHRLDEVFFQPVLVATRPA